MKTKQEKKTAQRLWIRVLETCVTDMSIFIAGQTYQVTDQQLEAIDKELNARRQKLPKEHRSAIRPFTYKVTVAPWDAFVSADQLALDALYNQRSNAVVLLEDLDLQRQTLAEQKKQADAELASLDKEAKSKYDKLLRRRAAARVESIAAEIEIVNANADAHTRLLPELDKDIEQLKSEINGTETTED